MPDYTGQRFGNYRLLHLIGRGGFAEVYLGEHSRLGMKAALKILYAHLEAQERELFLREARTVADLRHPHIVRVLDFDLREGQPFLVLDYAPYGSLAQRHPRGNRVPLDLVEHYVEQVAQALQYAHDRRIIHRDIKPANMLIGEQGTLLLSDFGLATIAHATSSLKTESSHGTLAYMAPEQLQGRPRPASDQYALAVSVYQWLTGELPFQGSSTEVIAQHLTAPVPSPRTHVPDLPEEVERVVMTALAKDPAERFGDVQTFATALAEACQLPPSSSQPSHLAMRPSVDAAAPVPPPMVSPDPNRTIPVPPTNSQIEPPVAPLTSPLDATQPLTRRVPVLNTAQAVVRPTLFSRLVSRGQLFTPLALASMLIIPFLMLLSNVPYPHVDNSSYLTLNVPYCFVLGCLIARRGAKFWQTLWFVLLADLVLFLTNGVIAVLYEIHYYYNMNAMYKSLIPKPLIDYVFTNYKTYTLVYPFLWLGIATIVGLVGHSVGWWRQKSAQQAKEKATDSIEQLVTSQGLGTLVSDFPTSKPTPRFSLGIGPVLIICLCIIIFVTLLRLFSNYIFLLFLLGGGLIVWDMFRRVPTEKVYLYTGGLIIPTPAGLLAVRWDEIAHTPSPQLLACHSGILITLPEVTENFQLLHTTIQQQIAHTRPQTSRSPHA